VAGITWDEAFDTIAAKISGSKKKVRPRVGKDHCGKQQPRSLLNGRLMLQGLRMPGVQEAFFEAKSHWLADMRILPLVCLLWGIQVRTIAPGTF